MSPFRMPATFAPSCGANWPTWSTVSAICPSAIPSALRSSSEVCETSIPPVAIRLPLRIADLVTMNAASHQVIPLEVGLRGVLPFQQRVEFGDGELGGRALLPRQLRLVLRVAGMNRQGPFERFGQSLDG